jgi:hypothetical protein
VHYLLKIQIGILRPVKKRILERNGNSRGENILGDSPIGTGTFYSY